MDEDIYIFSPDLDLIALAAILDFAVLDEDDDLFLSNTVDELHAMLADSDLNVLQEL
jgi:hypothetical protein